MKDLNVVKYFINMSNLTKAEAIKLAKLIQEKKLEKNEVKVMGKLLNKFLMEIIEIDKLRKEIKKLDDKILKTLKNSTKAKIIAG